MSPSTRNTVNVELAPGAIIMLRKAWSVDAQHVCSALPPGIPRAYSATPTAAGSFASMVVAATHCSGARAAPAGTGVNRPLVHGLSPTYADRTGSTLVNTAT